MWIDAGIDTGKIITSEFTALNGNEDFFTGVLSILFLYYNIISDFYLFFIVFYLIYECLNIGENIGKLTDISYF